MANSVADYHYKRIWTGICEVRSSLHQLRKLEADIGALPDFDDELAEVKRLGGLYWNDDPKKGEFRDAPEGVAVPVRETKRG